MDSSIEWKPITSASSYLISNTGRIFNTKRNKELAFNKHSYNIRLDNGELGRFSHTKLMRDHWNGIEAQLLKLDRDEEAKPVIDHPGYYITNKARIWSDHSCKWLSTPRIWEYHNIATIGTKSYRLSRLVGKHFLADYIEDLCVLHHKEDLPFPNIHFASNLWMGTKKENSEDMVDKGRASWQTTPTYKSISPNKAKELRESGMSVKQIANQYGLSRQAVYNKINS